LREGVPLNWGQVEDDLELLTLARLQGAAQEARLRAVGEPPASERAELIEQLAKRLPTPAPPKPARAIPKTLAGFSERVQVLTQVEENVPMRASVPKLLMRGALAAIVVGVVIFGFSTLIGVFTTPAYRWIEIRKGDDVLNRVLRPSGWQAYPCKVERQQKILHTEWFHAYTTARVVRDRLTFDIPLLPVRVTQPTTATLEYGLASIAPCDPDEEISNDPGAILKLDYSVKHTIIDPTAPLTTLGSPTGEKEVIVPLVVYVAKDQPLPLNAREGTWREVFVPQAKGGSDMHGVLWRGDYFHDRSGVVSWYGEMIVLMVERDDMIMVLTGSAHDGITDGLLLEIAGNVAW
jgi:hypothetical protein